MKAVSVPINSVFQDPENARIHSESQLQTICASLKRFGQQKPIVIDTNKVIVAGNGTHAAAQQLGWETISVIVSELPAQEARAYGIADNQIATQSDWDLTTLTKHIKTLSEWDAFQDWEALGFEKNVLEPVIDAETEEESENALTNYLEGAPPENNKEKSPMSKPYKVTEEQRDLIDQALNIVRLQAEDFKMSDGRALELLVGDWLSGIYQEHPPQTENQ